MASDRLAPSTHGLFMAVGASRGRRLSAPQTPTTWDLSRRSRSRSSRSASRRSSSPAASRRPPPRSGSPRRARPLRRRQLGVGVSYVRRRRTNPTTASTRRRRSDALPGGGAPRLPRLAMVSVIGRGRLGSAALLFSSAPGGAASRWWASGSCSTRRATTPPPSSPRVALRNLLRHPRRRVRRVLPGAGGRPLWLCCATPAAVPPGRRSASRRGAPAFRDAARRPVAVPARARPYLHGHGRLHGDLARRRSSSPDAFDRRWRSCAHLARRVGAGAAATMATPLYMSPEACRRGVRRALGCLGRRRHRFGSHPLPPV